MTCPAKLYISKAYDIPITIATQADFVIADIAELSITFKLTGNPSITKTFTYTGGDISIVGSAITLSVLQSDITTAGDYHLIIDLTDTSAKLRGITPCPDSLTFHTQ